MRITNFAKKESQKTQRLTGTLVESCEGVQSGELDKGPALRSQDVVAWFKSRPQDELDRVEIVVLDMSKAF